MQIELTLARLVRLNFGLMAQSMGGVCSVLECRKCSFSCYLVQPKYVMYLSVNLWI